MLHGWQCRWLGPWLSAMLWTVVLLSASSARAKPPRPPNLTLVVDALTATQRDLLDRCLSRSLERLPAPWTLSVVGARFKALETSPTFRSIDRRAVRNAVGALSQGKQSLAQRLRHAIGNRHAGSLGRNHVLMVTTHAFSAALDKNVAEAGGRGLVLHPLLVPKGRVPNGGSVAQGSGRDPSLDDAFAKRISTLLERIVQFTKQRATTAQRAREREAERAWNWRDYLFLIAGLFAAMVVLRMVWAIRHRRRLRKARQEQREELALAIEAIHREHGLIVGALEKLLAFVMDVYAIFPCKRCEETLFLLHDITSNGRSVELQCTACDKKVWAKCGIATPPEQLDDDLESLHAASVSNGEAAASFGLQLSYPPLQIVSNAEFEEGADGVKRERVIVRERIVERPKALVKCSYCNKMVYYDGSCPECGARLEGDAS